MKSFKVDALVHWLSYLKDQTEATVIPKHWIIALKRRHYVQPLAVWSQCCNGQDLDSETMANGWYMFDS